MNRFLYFVMLIFPGMLTAQSADFISLQQNEAENYKIVTSEYYDGKSLWGYMDGGADLYLEYGFEGLLVQEITYKEISVKCEIYKMNDPLSAFGIFSVQRHNCKQIAGFKTMHCANNYQVQIVKGDYYISIINQSGTPTTQVVSADLAEKFGKQIPDKDILLPNHPYFAGKSGKLIYLKGEVSLSNVYPQALSYLDDVRGYNMWILPAEDKKTPTVSIISFKEAGELKKYGEYAFPGQGFETVASKKLKSGGLLISRKLDENTVLQAEGNIGKELKKLLGFKN